MKVSRKQLKKIILEEYHQYLLELNACHSKSTGKLSSCAPGDSYSLSEPAVRAAGWKSDKAGKGKITGKGKVSARFGMAAGAKACGRKTVPGDKINPKYKCADFPETYKEADNPLVPSIDDSESDRRDKLGYPKHLQALGRGIIRADEALVNHEDSRLNLKLSELMGIIDEALDELADELANEGVQEDARAQLGQKCRQVGFTTKQDAQRAILVALNNFHRASDGRLFEPAKK